MEAFPSSFSPNEPTVLTTNDAPGKTNEVNDLKFSQIMKQSSSWPHTNNNSNHCWGKPSFNSGSNFCLHIQNACRLQFNQLDFPMRYLLSIQWINTSYFLVVEQTFQAQVEKNFEKDRGPIYRKQNIIKQYI